MEIANVLEKTYIGGRYGLDIQTSFFQYVPPQIEALASKNVDVAFTSVVPTANFLAKLPNTVKVIAYLGASTHGLVVPENSSLKSLADFKDKSIAVAFGTILTRTC
jgi:ABC-type nitrate/sulfonate/bicarbonate transport system substrate-binding protein